MKKQNKKGFTLAELLIVVAIIAVLTAIAIPLFVGALDKAQDARDDANIRSVKSAAAVYILGATKNDNNHVIFKTESDNTVTNDLYEYYVVKATVKANGDISITSIKGQSTDPRTAAAGAGATAAVKDEAKAGTTSGDWDITAVLTSLDLSEA